MRKATFYVAKGLLLEAKRPPFANMLTVRGLHTGCRMRSKWCWNSVRMVFGKGVLEMVCLI